jgi:hypothetical protein
MEKQEQEQLKDLFSQFVREFANSRFMVEQEIEAVIQVRNIIGSVSWMQEQKDRE